MNHIVDGVFIGDWTDAAALHQARKSGDARFQDFVIVSMAADSPFGAQGDFVFHMVDGPDAANEFQIWRARNAIEEQQKAGKKVLVHCAAGVSRSTSAVIAWMMKYKGLDYDAALTECRIARPTVNPCPSLADLVRSWAIVKHVHDGVEYA